MVKTKKVEETQQSLIPTHTITFRKRLKLKKIKKAKGVHKTNKTKKKRKCQKYNTESILSNNSPQKDHLNESNLTGKKIDLSNDIFSESEEQNEIKFSNAIHESKINKVKENIFSNIVNINDNNRILNTRNESISSFDHNNSNRDIEKNISQPSTPLLSPFKPLNKLFYSPQEISIQNIINLNFLQNQNNFSITNSNFSYLSNNNQEINPNLNNNSSAIYFNQNNNNGIVHNNIDNNRNNNNNIYNNDNRFIQNIINTSTLNVESQNRNSNHNINDNNLEINNNIRNNNIDSPFSNSDSFLESWFFNGNNRRNNRPLSTFREFIKQKIKSIKENITKTKIKKIIDLEDNKKNCIICLNEFKKGQNIYCLPCSHVFHIRCLNKEIKIRQTCPICRKELKEKSQINN